MLFKSIVILSDYQKWESCQCMISIEVRTPMYCSHFHRNHKFVNVIGARVQAQEHRSLLAESSKGTVSVNIKGWKYNHTDMLIEFSNGGHQIYRWVQFILAEWSMCICLGNAMVGVDLMLTVSYYKISNKQNKAILQMRGKHNQLPVIC